MFTVYSDICLLHHSLHQVLIVIPSTAPDVHSDICSLHQVLELDSEADHDMIDPDNNPPDIDEMLDEFEDLSDSGPEIDTISVMSTPKPRLRYAVKAVKYIR